MTAAIPLRFGIRALDELIVSGREPAAVEKRGIWTAAVVGPDGCGKSILALHLASSYWQDHGSRPQPPKVIYVSTDLSYDQAREQWRSFGLEYPQWRQKAVESAYDNCDRRLEAWAPNADRARLALHPLRPVADAAGKQKKEFLRFLSPADDPNVYFFDLQAETAGDDWGFINHLVGLLPRRGATDDKHLLIIDAVEGLEAFVGDKDAFGQNRDRRSRVAQLIRRATAIGVHVVFIVEEPQAEARLPEQFVTDLVVRLRHQRDGNYTQRTVEIEKCRAVAHVRGQHEFCIRHGRGSRTGRYSNLDDPEIIWKSAQGRLHGRRSGAAFELRRREDSGRKRERRAQTDDECLAHMHVIPSLYFQNRKIREFSAQVPEAVGSATFGLLTLDRLLESQQVTAPLNAAASTAHGGSSALLLGEPGTHKGRLARRYLAQAFSFDSNAALTKEAGAAVLLSTRFIDQHMLITRMLQHLRTPAGRRAEVERELRKRVFCHRFGTRHLTSGAFIDILQRYLQEAQKIVLDHGSANGGDPAKCDIETRRQASPRIRFVLEDWSVLLATYPNLQREPLLLSTVLSLFRREGVSALLVSTQPGQPGTAVGSEAYELRNLDEPQILTWTVPFYGDRRVAVTAYAVGAPHRAPMICELESPPGENERLNVNRHFDLYADVDVGRPHRVPLVVRLYLGNHASADDAAIPRQFSGLLHDTFQQLFPAPIGQETVKIEPFTEYDRLSTFAEVLDDSHLDHTLVFQVDEFWSIGKRKSLFNLTNYWTTPVAYLPGAAKSAQTSRELVTEDEEMGFFTPHPRWHEPPQETPPISSRVADDMPAAADGSTPLHRWNFFLSAEDGGMPSHYDVARSRHLDASPIDRIPYVWDFGMLLANRDLWKRHAALRVPRQPTGNAGGDEVTIAAVWNSLCRTGNPRLKLEGESANFPEQKDGINWDLFLAACRTIGRLENIPAFDVDLSTVESLSCWVLELWASIERENTLPAYDDCFRPLTRRGSEGGPSDFGLHALLERAAPSLLKALVQTVYTCPHLRARDRSVFREHVSRRAVASREWYHTASAMMRGQPEVHYVPLALPGSHAVRGDWHLAVAAGSRSEVLAQRTLDLLSSRRNNLLRLQDGIGLPVRDVLPDVHLGDVPTAMSCFDEGRERLIPLGYGDLCRLGRTGRKPKFDWLWRSRIRNYQRDCFYWRRWIARMIEEQHLWLPPEIVSDVQLLRTVLDPAFPKVCSAAWKQTLEPCWQRAMDEFDRLRRILESAVRGDPS